MVNISSLHKELAQKKTRNIDIKIDVLTKNNADIWTLRDSHINKAIDLNISAGKTSGGFVIGSTDCFVLEATFNRKTAIPQNARIDVSIRFINPLNQPQKTDWIMIGMFYVDEISVDENTKKITAMDKMLNFERNYKSTIAYPTRCENIIYDIAGTAGIDVVDLDLLNNTAILSYPIKWETNSGEKVKYSRREMLGFIACLQGGGCYFTRDGKLKFWKYERNPVPLEIEKAITYTMGDVSYTVEDVIWADEDTEELYKTVAFKNPLEVRDAEKSVAVSRLKSFLIGKPITELTVEQPLTGFYDLGEIVEVIDETGTHFDIIVSGISYSISNSGIRETIYSVASTESETANNSVDSGEDNKVNYTGVSYAVNVAPYSLTNEYQEVLSLQFTSMKNGKGAVFITLNGLFSVSGNVDVKVTLDETTVHAFTHKAETGYQVISINLPLVGMENGGHTVIVSVKGTAEAVFANESSYLTLIGTGISTLKTFDGTIKCVDRAHAIQIDDDEIRVMPIFENGTVYIGDLETENFADIVPTITITENAITIGAISDSIELEFNNA